MLSKNVSVRGKHIQRTNVYIAAERTQRIAAEREERVVRTLRRRSARSFAKKIRGHASKGEKRPESTADGCDKLQG